MITVPSKLAHHILAVLAAALVVAGCSKSSSSSPTSQQLSDFVGSVTTSDGSVTASLQRGTPPPANGGPAVAPTVSGSSSAAVVSGGSGLVSLNATSPFRTVNVSVIDDPLDGYFKLDLPVATTSTTILLKLGSSVPVSTFQTVFSVALGTSVGPSSSIANSVKTPTSVVVGGTSPTLGGAAQQFTATASFSDNTSQTVTDQATWQSSASNVAQVTSGGLVSAVAAGEADVTATFGAISGHLHVTIAAASSGGGTFTVNGTVTDATTHGLLPNVTIAIGSRSTTTDASGNYTVNGVGGGTITVVASAVSYTTSQQTVVLSANTRVDFVLARAVAATFSVNGTVTNATSGARLPGATVAIGSSSTTTDASGNYTLSGISGGTVTVVASANSYATSQQTVALSADTRVDFALVPLTPTASIAVQNPPCKALLDVNGSPQPVTCTFVGSSTNITSPVYSWTFTNPFNGKSVTATGAQVSPTFDCSFDSGHNPFTVNVTLTVTGGGGPATASTTVQVTRQIPQCSTG